MDVLASDQLGVGCYQQKSDHIKLWWLLDTIQGADAVSSLSHPFFLSYPEVVSSNPGTAKKFNLKIIMRKIYFTGSIPVLPKSLLSPQECLNVTWYRKSTKIVIKW